MIPLRRGARQQQPPREAGVEVARDRKAGEDAAEGGRLQEHEGELEGRVAGLVVEVRARRAILDRPPAKAARKNSGKISDGSRIAGLASVLCTERQATPRATKHEAPHVRTSRFFIAAPANDERDHAERQREAEAERERLRRPSR